MKEFDPFGWLEKYFSAHTLHIMIRAGIALLLAAFLVHRIFSYKRYWFKPLWGVETLIFAVFLVSYIIRKDPVDRSRGAREIIIPLIGGVLPFALLFSPVHPVILSSIKYIYAVFIWMTAGTEAVCSDSSCPGAKAKTMAFIPPSREIVRLTMLSVGMVSTVWAISAK